MWVVGWVAGLHVGAKAGSAGRVEADAKQDRRGSRRQRRMGTTQVLCGEDTDAKEDAAWRSGDITHCDTSDTHT
jgi:hypothetical protein